MVNTSSEYLQDFPLVFVRQAVSIATRFFHSLSETCFHNFVRMMFPLELSCSQPLFRTPPARVPALEFKLGVLLPCVLCDLVKVISGQNLPKPGDIKGEIVDPYVVLQVAGVKEDRREFKTKVVKDNGKYKFLLLLFLFIYLLLLFFYYYYYYYYYYSVKKIAGCYCFICLLIFLFIKWFVFCCLFGKCYIVGLELKPVQLE